MLNKNYAQTIAQIGYMTRPKVTKGNSIDFAGAIDAYYKAKDRKQAEEDRQLDKDRRDALTNAINNDETLSDTQKALFASDPNSYASFLQGNQNLANQRAMADYNHSLNMEMQDRKDAIAREIAQIKAGGNGLVNINMSNPFDKKRIEKAASDMDANIAKAQEMKTTFEQANNALQNIKTGTPFAMLTKNRPLLSNADEEAFDSAAAKSIDMVRKAGTGPMTDADARRYEKASIDRGKSKEANQLLIDSGIIAADNSIAREELRAEWVANGGRLGDFDKEWRNYLNSNPIFGEDGKINKNRQDAFNWFSGNQQAVDPRVQQALDAGYSMDEINAFLGR